MKPFSSNIKRGHCPNNQGLRVHFFNFRWRPRPATDKRDRVAKRVPINTNTISVSNSKSLFVEGRVFSKLSQKRRPPFEIDLPTHHCAQCQYFTITSIRINICTFNPFHLTPISRTGISYFFSATSTITNDSHS